MVTRTKHANHFFWYRCVECVSTGCWSDNALEGRHEIKAAAYIGNDFGAGARASASLKSFLRTSEHSVVSKPVYSKDYT